MRSKLKKTVALISAAMVIAGFYLLPGGKYFSTEAVSAIGIFLGALILWIMEALPMSVTTMLMICVLAFERILPFQNSVAAISTSTSLFIMASSGITVAVAGSSLPRWLTEKILRRFSSHPWLLVFEIGYLVALSSSIMSSLATCALFGCIIDLAVSHGNRSMRRCLMMLIPACAGIGGFMSPAGTPANILLMDMLKQNQIPITFVSWCRIGYPIGLLATGLFILSSLLILRPVMKTTMNEPADAVVITKKDRRVIVILLLTVIGWLASSWMKEIDICMVAVISMTVMFLPQVELLSWESFSKNVNWDLVITMGTVSVLMAGIAKTGLFSSVIEALSGPLAHLPMFWILVCVSVFICTIRAFIPTTTAVVVLLGPVLVGIAGSTGLSAGVLIFMLAFWTASALLLIYTEPIYLITYNKRDYSAIDLFRVGIGPVVALTFFLAFLLPRIIVP